VHDTSGKRAIRKLPREITELNGALKAIIQMESKSAKKAGTFTLGSARQRRALCVACVRACGILVRAIDGVRAGCA
jgi:hypothetical protein